VPLSPDKTFCSSRFVTTTVAGCISIIRFMAASRHVLHSVYGLLRKLLKTDTRAEGQAGLMIRTTRHPRSLAMAVNVGTHWPA
jgi:hypothetical protein